MRVMERADSPTLADTLSPERRARLLAGLEELERAIGALPERLMRRSVLEARVQAMSDSELVGSLTLLVGRVAEGRPAARVLLVELALDDSVLSALPYERKASAYALARAAGALGVARMFLSPVPQDNPTADEALVDNEHLSLPLGVRRSAARTRDRLLLDRLVHDRDPRVIAMLLDNPRVVERDVVRIAAMRPTRPEVLAELARHARWSSNYRVRKALACNPYTPRPVALRLLPSLMLQDLRLALETASLDRVVEEEMRRLVALRAGRSAQPLGAPAPEPATDAEIEALIASLGAEELAEAPLEPTELEGAREHQEEAPTNPFAEEDADQLKAEIEALIALGREGFTLRPVEDEDPFDQT